MIFECSFNHCSSEDATIISQECNGACKLAGNRPRYSNESKLDFGEVDNFTCAKATIFFVEKPFTVSTDLLIILNF